ncbi:M24 family metallopeptidase [Dialister succinatiphilus]|mgnify:FL=1|uniref:M24 family metallopeptidase n=1 Tax=Dialister succinatiphilus TaxID=487173 RepID=UPI00402951E9
MIFLIDKQMISESLSKWGVDGLFVQKDENLRYISGFTGSDSYLFVTPESFYLLTDSRYVEQAKEEAKGFTVVDYRGKLAETLARLSSSHHVKRLGIESVLSYRMYLSFDETMPDVDFEFCPVDDVRRIKSDEELSLLKRACEISDEGFKNTIPYIRAGVTERYLQAVLECEMLKAGSEGKSFDTIVASGERGAYPHGTATEKVIENGDLITFDFGAIYKGYHSDITRTLAVGDISSRQRFLYDKVLGCNEHVEGLLKAGIRADEADTAAREYFKKWGLDAYFTHALGHSVGLEIHEAPVLAQRDHSVLEVNMTETVEPGVYIPGTGGVRIEDTVVIKQDGISILTQFPKKFLQV